MDLIYKKKENRAQIFQSFDSLKGFKEMIQECEVEIVSPRILSQDDYEILNERENQRIYEDVYSFIKDAKD